MTNQIEEQEKIISKCSVCNQDYEPRNIYEWVCDNCPRLSNCHKCGADGELILLAWSIDIENDFDVYWEIECVCGESIRGDDASELCKKWAHLTTASA